MNGHVPMSVEGAHENQINGDLVEDNGARMKMDAVTDERHGEHQTDDDDIGTPDLNNSRKSSAYDESESKTTPSTEQCNGEGYGSRRVSNISNALSEHDMEKDEVKKLSVENLNAYQNESESAEQNETSDDHHADNGEESAKEKADRKSSTVDDDEFAILEAQCKEEANRERLPSKTDRSPIASPVNDEHKGDAEQEEGNENGAAGEQREGDGEDIEQRPAGSPAEVTEEEDVIRKKSFTESESHANDEEDLQNLNVDHHKDNHHDHSQHSEHEETVPVSRSARSSIVIPADDEINVEDGRSKEGSRRSSVQGSRKSSVISQHSEHEHSQHSEHEETVPVSRSARSSIVSPADDQIHVEDGRSKEGSRKSSVQGSRKGSVISHQGDEVEEDKKSEKEHDIDEKEEPAVHEVEELNEKLDDHKVVTPSDEGESQIEIVIRPSEDDAITVTISHDLSGTHDEKEIEAQSDESHKIHVDEHEDVTSPNDENLDHEEEDKHETEQELATEDHEQVTDEHEHGSEEQKHDTEEHEPETQEQTQATEKLDDGHEEHEHGETKEDQTNIEPEVEVVVNIMESAAKPEDADEKFMGEERATIDVETNEVKHEPSEEEEETKANEEKIETEQTERLNMDESNQQIEQGERAPTEDISVQNKEAEVEVEEKVADEVEKVAVEEENIVEEEAANQEAEGTEAKEEQETVAKEEEIEQSEPKEEASETLSPKMDVNETIETKNEAVDEDNNENIPDSEVTGVTNAKELVAVDDSNNNNNLEKEAEESCKIIKTSEASAVKEQQPEPDSVEPVPLQKPSSVKTPSKKAPSRTPAAQKPQSPRTVTVAATSSRGRARGPASIPQSSGTRPTASVTVPKPASALNRRTQSHSPARPSLEEAMKAAKNVDMRAIFGRSEAHEERKKRREEFIQKKKAEAESKQSVEKEQRRKEAEAAFQCWLQRKAQERKRAKSAGRVMPSDGKEITDEEKIKHRDEAQAAFQAWLDRKKDDTKERKRQMSAGVHSQQFVSS